MKNIILIITIIALVQVLNAQQGSIIINRKNNAAPVNLLADSMQQMSFTLWGPCPGIPTVTHLGKIYNTVQLGSQCWLRENLDVGTMISGALEQTNNGLIEKYCYNNDTVNCTKYGGLYQWAEAVQYKNGAANTIYTNPPFSNYVQGMCPTGWHIPTQYEFEVLCAAVNDDGNKLKAIGQGSQSGIGTNTSGFSALMTGLRTNGTFINRSKTGFWSSMGYSFDGAYYRELDGSNHDIDLKDASKTEGASIRCIRDVGTLDSIPIQPKLSSPVDKAAGIPVSTTLTWQASMGATSYYLQVSKGDSSFSNINLIFNVNTGNVTSKWIYGLLPLTTYYWRVCAVNSHGTSAFSTIWSFTIVAGGTTGVPCPGTPSISYAGKTYNTVMIGTQCWLKENLDVGEMIPGTQNQSNNQKIEKYCYNNDTANCTKYGGLYQWAEVVQYKNGATNSTSPNPAFSGHVQGICPTGWHIPTDAEYQFLSSAVNGDGQKLKSIGVGQGNDSYKGNDSSGFSALMVGNRYYNDGNFNSSDSDTRFWSTIGRGTGDANDMWLNRYYGSVNLGSDYKTYGFSVRCLKDIPIPPTDSPCPGTPSVSYAGKTYNTVMIGTQCWLKENLDVGEMIPGTQNQSNNQKIEKYCYNNDTANCTKYGGLYQWAEVVQYKNGATSSTSPNPAFLGYVQGICPTGWHIPTKAEYEILISSVNNSIVALLMVGQGTGTNTSGFSALLTTELWNSTEYTESRAYFMSLQSIDDFIYISYAGKIGGLNARCIKDTAPSIPTLSSPANKATKLSVAPTLSWNTSNGASTFTLQVSANSSFSNTVYNQNDLTGTSQKVTGLSKNTTYYWRVSASNVYGTSAYSNIWSFTTNSNPCQGVEYVNYSGNTYNTVEINNQCWLKENLNVGTMITGSLNQTNNGTIEKFCYNNDTANCRIYGGLYQWDEAMQYVTKENAQGICPPGWHIPSKADLYDTLSASVNNSRDALLSVGQLSGTNKSGFSALLAGYRRNIGGGFLNLGNFIYLWCSTEVSTDNANGLGLYYLSSSVNLLNYTKPNGFSVRCLKD